MKRTILIVIAVIMMATMMSVHVVMGATASENSVKLSVKRISLPVGSTHQLKLRNKPKKGKVTWRSGNKKIATVTKKGKVKGKKIGNTKIYCIVRKGQKRVKLVCRIRVVKTSAKNTQSSVITTPTAVPIATVTATPVPSNSAEPVSETRVNTGTTIVNLGMNLTELEEIVGNAAYTLTSEYEGCTWHVYNRDYKKLSMVLVKDNNVVGVYTDSKDFSYGDINTNTNYRDLETAGFVTNAYKETYYKNVGNVVVNAYMDNIADKTVEGILVVNKMTANVNSGLSSTYEKISFEVTNSFRVKNGMSAFVWKDNVATVAKKHSMDMKNNNYFNHTSPSGEDLGNRLKSAGLNYSAYAENIAMGYENGFEATFGWINSSGHRSNMLFDAVTDLGVGIDYSCTYYTQVFYREL